MDEYREVSKSIDVPANTGVDGMLRTLKQILLKPRVQRIEANARGRVTYTRYVRNDEPEENFGIDFDDLQPYHVIRNAELREFMPPPELSAPLVISLMFEQAALERLHPIAFATGAASSVWAWYRHTSGHTPSVRTQLFGLPVLLDRQIPDTVLLLCAGFGRDAAFVDTQVSYKVELPSYALPPTDVQVLP